MEKPLEGHGRQRMRKTRLTEKVSAHGGPIKH